MPVEAPPAPVARDPFEGRSAFRYQAGTRTYEVTSDATIQRLSDTATQGTTVRTSALVTLTFETTPDTLLTVAGSVDRYEIIRGDAIPAPDSIVPSSASFRATMTATGKIVSFIGDTIRCSPQEPLFAAARRAIVLARYTLDAGTRWSDSASTTICRGGTPITTGIVRDYEVEAREMANGVPVARVRRHETFTLAGSSSANGRSVAITGRGASDAVLRFDLLRGLFLGEEGSSETKITVSASRTQTEFLQREMTTVRGRN